MLSNLRFYLYAALAAVLVVLALWFGVAWLASDETVDTPVPTAPAPVLRGETKVATAIATPVVRAYSKRAKAKLKLPAPLADDAAKVVLDSSQVAASRRDTLITTLLDTETGETVTVAEQRPLPWLASDGRGQLWLGAGYKNGEPTLRGDLQHGLFAVKRMRVSARASVDVPINGGGVDWFAGVGAGVEW